MPLKRFRKKTTGYGKKRFAMSKKIRYAKRARSIKVHNFKRVVELDSIYSNTSAVTGGIAFRLNSIPNSTEFTNLFDRYRIRGVQIKFVPALTSSDVNPDASKSWVPNLHTAIDLNDSLAPAGSLVLMEYDTYRMTRGLSVHKRYLRPRITQELYQSAGVTGYGMGSRNMWLDCTNSGIDIAHYGIKYAIEASGVNTYRWRVYVTYYFQTYGTK